MPAAWRDRLHKLADRAIGFARDVAAASSNEADARRATSSLYHVASAVAMAWEAHRIHERRGDARRLLMSRLVVEHRLMAPDPFSVVEDETQKAIAAHLLDDRDVSMAEAARLMMA